MTENLGKTKFVQINRFWTPHGAMQDRFGVIHRNISLFVVMPKVALVSTFQPYWMLARWTLLSFVTKQHSQVQTKKCDRRGASSQSRASLYGHMGNQNSAISRKLLIFFRYCLRIFLFYHINDIREKPTRPSPIRP